ncbi:MAG TPA: two-component regulator propeller domain-containing protein [Bacteroidia bacterium]|nr:two-component regulator propeller domain-containing protein [Bacteroidia bacterium]
MHTSRTTTFYLTRYLILLLSLGLSNNAFAQSSQYKNYGVKDGLPSSEVYSVMQDSKGYMWFGTDHGASRFDGYSFKSFTPSDGLADPMVLECIEDYKGRIWFRSLSGKLSYYFHDSIFRLPVNDSLVKALNNGLILSMVTDTSEILYLSAHGRPSLISIDLKHNYSISVMQLPFNINYIGKCHSNRLLYGDTFLSFVKNKSDTAGCNYLLSSFNINSGKTVLTKSYDWKKITKHTYWMHDKAIMLPDNKTAVLLGSVFMVIDSNQILKKYSFENSPLNMTADKDGNVWIVFQEDAPILYSKGKIIQYPVIDYLKDKQVTSIAIDAEGALWFSTLHSGVFYLSSLNFKTWNKENGLPGNKLNLVAVAPDHSIWVAVQDNPTLTVIHNDLLTYKKIPCAFAQFSMTGLLFISPYNIWVSSTSGLYILNRNSTLAPFSHGPYGTYQLVPDTEGVWLNGNSTIELYKQKGDSIRLLKHTLFKAKIYSICKNSNGGLWLGTLAGLWRYINDSLIDYGTKYPVLRNGVDYLQESTTGCLWMATRDTGVIMMQKNKLLHLTTTEGLLSNFTKCLCIDYKGNVWVGTQEGVSRIIVHTDNIGICHLDTIKNMNSDNLIEVNYITCDSNMVYVATNNGLTSFDMNKIESNKTPPPIYITSIKVNNKISSSSTAMNLHYDENYIAINFLGIAYRNAGNIQYRYKMTGIDTGWIYTKYTSIQYPKLEPGSYTFSVSAMNNDGVWSITPAAVSFIIAPPFWATWWARTAMGLIIITLIYWRIKVVEKREKNKTEVSKQLATFELKELKAQLDPHFLFNSLNTLTHLVEKVPAQAPEFVEELSTFYRYTLLHRNSEFTELKAEMEQAERYLKLLRIRFGDQLKVDWHIDEQYKNYLIPTNSLQLLFENITKHNVIMPDNPLWADIATSSIHSLIIKNQLRLKPVPPLSNGIGLNSINERYRLMAAKKINITQTTGYFSVELPLISPQEYEDINY